MIFNWSLTRRGKMSCKSFLIKTVSRQIRCLFCFCFCYFLCSFFVSIAHFLFCKSGTIFCMYLKPLFNIFKPPCCLSVILDHRAVLKEESEYKKLFVSKEQDKVLLRRKLYRLNMTHRSPRTLRNGPLNDDYH